MGEEKTNKIRSSASSFSLSKIVTHEDMCQCLNNYRMKSSGSIFGNNNTEVPNARPLTSDFALRKKGV